MSKPPSNTRILIAGFQHETNTFGATQATMADFEMADSWPGLLQGDEVLTGTSGSNLPLAGFVCEARRNCAVDLVPVVWASAEPSAHVSDDAFDTISRMILDGIKQAGRLDGIYLDLHGAMVTESHMDGEGALLKLLRAAVGPELPISISLDLHANISQQMVDLASSITLFRTYPHLDMAQTGGRAFYALMHLIEGGTLRSAFRQAPFLIPLHAQYTGSHPCKHLYDEVARAGAGPHRWAEFAPGFTAADIPDMGPSLLAYAHTQAEADTIVGLLYDKLLAAESEFDTSLLDPLDAVRQAISINESSGQPVVIADVQDNPGAGGSSDTTGLLQALVEAGARDAVVGMLCDPQMSAMAHEAGIGGAIEGDLGGKLGPDKAPFRGRFRVAALSDGQFAFSGEMYAGSVADTGPVAVLELSDVAAGIRVVVSGKRCQCLDQAIFTHVGIEPQAQRIVVVKSTVHFRADFEAIAAAVLNVAAPGLFPCNLDTIDYQHLRPGVRVLPV